VSRGKGGEKMIGLELKIREAKRRRLPPPTRRTPSIGGTKASVPGELESEV